MILVFEAFEYTLRRHISQNSCACCLFDSRVRIVQREYQRPESGWTNPAEPLGAFYPNVGVCLLRHALNEHKLTLGTKVCDSE